LPSNKEFKVKVTIFDCFSIALENITCLINIGFSLSYPELTLELIAIVIAASRDSIVRALAERIISFNLDQHNSIGDKSGE
jgi:hypothetical protein